VNCAPTCFFSSHKPSNRSPPIALATNLACTVAGVRTEHSNEPLMSSNVAATAYWRIAGMSYLKYANACAEVVRQSLKEPFLSQVG